MATDQVSHIIDQVRDLPADAQARLLDELQQLRKRNSEQPAHSLLELIGLGRELWEGVDAQEYVRNERAAWNG
jgi:hypothetical protein